MLNVSEEFCFEAAVVVSHYWSRRQAKKGAEFPILEHEVRGYLLALRQRGAARGTFKTSQYGLRFLYRHTLGRAWGLFGEKKARRAQAEASA